MELHFLAIVIAVASLFAGVVADIDPSSPGVVEIGKTYNVSWTAAKNYTYTLWLVQEDTTDNPYAWTKFQVLGTGLQFSSLDVDFSWTAPSNLSRQHGYAIWLEAFNIPFNGGGDSGMTDWFAVSSSTNATSTSASASASSSAMPTLTATSSLSITMTSTPTHAPSSGHHDSLSGGAIAGIVIGVLLAIAIVIGAVFFLKWRKRRTGVQQREAAARAGRLEPVMQESNSAYEMHNRNP